MVAFPIMPWISFVVEWENALLSEGDRSAAMLQALCQQTTELATKLGKRSDGTDSQPLFELLVVHDEVEFSENELAVLLKRCVGDARDILEWRLVPTRDSGYFKNKDLGAREAHGEFIIFLDSDVVPEQNWLEELLAGLENPAVEIIAGSAYIEPVGLVGKVFALTWFFPLRSEDGPMRLVDSFFANNLAMRTVFYRQHPFPDLEGTSRGSCIVLASSLAEANIPMHQSPRARVSHPAPNGFGHVSKRALAQGRDRLFRERNYGSHRSASWLASCARLARHWGGSAWKICTRFHRVDLNPLLIPAAVAVAWYYYLLYWTGETMSHLGLSAIRKVRV